MLKRPLFSRDSFEEGKTEGNVMWFRNIAIGRVEIWPSDKNSGMKSHDHKVQRTSKAAAKAAENSVQCPVT